jgi:hypothetical protein
MRPNTVVLLVAVTCTLNAHVARGQSITTEGSITAGTSSDEVSAVATQLRAFGEVPDHIRYYVETAWATSSDDNSDAFGAAYPYRDRVQVIEAYGERMFLPGGTVVGARAGRYRTPFGISSGSDHAYTGFLRAPLIRYDGYSALSNNFLEHGADLLVGVPRFTVEASLGAPADVGSAVRRSGLDSVVRLQSVFGPAIVGVSHIRTLPYQPASFAFGHTDFTGIDVRWMRDGVQFRGEWITGRPFNGTTTDGWYADVMVHRVAMGPVTAVARVEQLDYDTTTGLALHTKRQTIGARIRLFEGLSAQVNVLHHKGQLDQYRQATIDVGVTYSVRHR